MHTPEMNGLFINDVVLNFPFIIIVICINICIAVNFGIFPHTFSLQCNYAKKLIEKSNYAKLRSCYYYMFQFQQILVEKNAAFKRINWQPDVHFKPVLFGENMQKFALIRKQLIIACKRIGQKILLQSRTLKALLLKNGQFFRMKLIFKLICKKHFNHDRSSHLHQYLTQ